MKKYTSLTACAVATFLTACGGGSMDDPVQVAPRASDTTVEGSVSVSSNVFGEPAFFANGSTVSGLEEITDTTQTFLRKSRAGRQTFTIFGNSGTAEVAVIASEDASSTANPNDAFLGAEFKRIGTSMVPVEGTSLMRGEYSGVVSDRNDIGAFHDVDEFVNGDAEIEFDFGNNSMTGAILNRRVLSPTGIPRTNDFSDIVKLGAAPINADGSYSGRATGGNINRTFGEGDSVGTFNGLITGANGEETVGSVTILHNETPNNGLDSGAAEVGVFYAIKQ